MKKHLWLILILIFGAALRYYHNTDISLWHDEAFSALLIKYNWGEMLYRVGLDVHPPAYYVFLRLWYYLFGDTLLSLRSFSVFFSVGVIWTAWLFVKTAFKNEKAALWTAALIAINPFQIQYATEARMYTLGACFSLLAAYFLVRALGFQTAKKNSEAQGMPNLPETIYDKHKMLWSYLGFTLSIVIMVYTHYYLLFAAAAIGFYGIVYLFFHHQGAFFEKFKWLLLSFGGVLLAYAPWLKTFLFQYGQVGSGYWIPAMDRWSVPSTLYTLLAGFGHDVSQPGVQKLLVFVCLLVLLGLYGFLKRTQSFHKWLVLLVSLAPFLGAVLFLILARLKGSNSSVYLVRYFIFTGAFLSIVFAVWLSEMKSKNFAFVLVLGLMLLNAWAFVNYWRGINIQKRAGMNSAARYLKANLEPEHKLFVGSSFMFFNLKYYASQTGIKNQPLLFSGGRSVENMLHFEGTAILTNSDILKDFKQGAKNGNTVWLVWTNGFGGSKPSLPLNWTQIAEKEFPEVRPYLGANVYVSEYKVN